VIERPSPAPVATPRRGLRLGPLPITPFTVLVTLALIGSTAFILYVILGIDEQQIPLLASGFAVLGASLAAVAIASLVGMWRAASDRRGGKALALAIFGGLAGLGAIGCFTVTALSAMVWTT
jgi:hypothetical protein